VKFKFNSKVKTDLFCLSKGLKIISAPTNILPTQSNDHDRSNLFFSFITIEIRRIRISN
jgi:hypothetical protein